MSIIKSVNSKSNSKAALNATLNYVFQEKKTSPALCLVTGDFMSDTITPRTILKEFMETKELWGKTKGRMHKHFVISWHEDTGITYEQALEICKEWCEKVFPTFQCAIAIHTDRDYPHGHIIVNSVSFMDGKKYHMHPRQLQQAKDFCDDINTRYGFTITQKGKHFDGTTIEEGTVHSYNKNTYKMLQKDTQGSKLVRVVLSILDVIRSALSKEEFVSTLEEKHQIKTSWKDSRKYITFEDTTSNLKVRNNNLSRTFTYDFSKEGLLSQIQQNKEYMENLSSETIWQAKQLASKLVEMEYHIISKCYRILHDLEPDMENNDFKQKMYTDSWREIMRTLSFYDSRLSESDPKLLMVANTYLPSYREEAEIRALQIKQKDPYAPSEAEIKEFQEKAKEMAAPFFRQPKKHYKRIAKDFDFEDLEETPVIRRVRRR